MDMIKTLKTWVQLLNGGIIGITFKTERPSLGRVYWRQGQDSPWNMSLGKAKHGLLPCNSLLHQVLIEDYNPFLPLEVQAACLPIEDFGAYKVRFLPEEKGAVQKLKPILTSKGVLRLGMVCDLHNQGEKLEECLEAAGEDISLCVLNGDTCDAPNNREDLERNLAGVVAHLTQKGLVTLYVRGNH